MNSSPPPVKVSMVYEYKKNADGHYVCTICNCVKKNQNTMHYHMQKHEGSRPHKCSHCDMTFIQKYALDTHTKIQHSDKVPEMKCPFENCDHTVHKKEYLRVHIARNHISETLKPWIVKSENAGSYSCDCCKKVCKSYPSILYHVMDHAKQTTDPILKARLAII